MGSINNRSFTIPTLYSILNPPKKDLSMIDKVILSDVNDDAVDISLRDVIRLSKNLPPNQKTILFKDIYQNYARVSSVKLIEDYDNISRYI